MLSDVLKLSWDEMLDSDFDLKSNSSKHVVQIDGECVGMRDCIVLIYYNIMLGNPYLCIVEKDGQDSIPAQEVPGFRMTKEVFKDEDSEWRTELVYLECAMHKALS